jgi:hypothetical protein
MAGDVVSTGPRDACTDKGEIMRMKRVAVALSLLALPALAFAGSGQVFDGTLRVPEPETLALIAGAAVAVGIVRWIRRK